MDTCSQQDDNDNDARNGFCAQQHQGAWWFSTCYHLNLSGKYEKGNTIDSVVWYTWKEGYYSLKTVEMKIRRV